MMEGGGGPRLDDLTRIRRPARPHGFLSNYQIRQQPDRGIRRQPTIPTAGEGGPRAVHGGYDRSSSTNPLRDTTRRGLRFCACLQLDSLSHVTGLCLRPHHVPPAIRAACGFPRCFWAVSRPSHLQVVGPSTITIFEAGVAGRWRCGRVSRSEWEP